MAPCVTIFSLYKIRGCFSRKICCWHPLFCSSPGECNAAVVNAQG